MTQNQQTTEHITHQLLAQYQPTSGTTNCPTADSIAIVTTAIVTSVVNSAHLEVTVAIIGTRKRVAGAVHQRTKLFVFCAQKRILMICLNRAVEFFYSIHGWNICTIM